MRQVEESHAREVGLGGCQKRRLKTPSFPGKRPLDVATFVLHMTGNGKGNLIIAKMIWGMGYDVSSQEGIFF